LNDPKVVEAAEGFVRIIIRRPHAYTFLQDLFEDRGGVTAGTPAGCTLGDGSNAPLPGVYILDAQGKFEAGVGLAEEGALKKLRAALAGS
jgi:hypothetical protein